MWQLSILTYHFLVNLRINEYNKSFGKIIILREEEIHYSIVCD